MQHATDLVREARLRIRVLRLFVGSADPIANAARDPSAIRRLIASGGD
jgi:hypothetical protein